MVAMRQFKPSITLTTSPHGHACKHESIDAELISAFDDAERLGRKSGDALVHAIIEAQETGGLWRLNS